MPPVHVMGMGCQNEYRKVSIDVLWWHMTSAYSTHMRSP